MIAGETEILVNRYSEEYDDFFGLFKKKEKKTKEEKQKRTVNRKKFWSGVGQTIKDLSALSIKPEPNQTSHGQIPPGAQDYQMSFGAPSEDKEDEKEDKKGDKTILPYVVGTVLIIGLGIWGYKHLQKANQAA